MKKFHEVEYLHINAFTLEQHCIVLRWNEKKRILPIWIGADDARAQIAREELPPPRRPRLLDIFSESCMRFGGGFKELRISYYYLGSFVAYLVTDSGEEIDCRVSDGIAIAHAWGIPVFASADVLAQASVFVSDADMSIWLGLDFGEDPTQAGFDDSASQDPQADLDFTQLMASLGVSEEDLMGLGESPFLDDFMTDEDSDSDGDR
ncbi:MAG: DUF151 domain-containing protein [Corynebacterium sp.]|uniref:bifunctional nuclease domain-containing protein n=1 Tax=Corynebacterium sp. TaxID=1720 RepID=UPI0026DBA1E8|nr:bifunctional nuclease domain-containing protein [Corynebacterium sp.]MDO4762535.1 DUF151 domain-containing protein [Corynebacterium sp.]